MEQRTVFDPVLAQPITIEYDPNHILDDMLGQVIAAQETKAEARRREREQARQDRAWFKRQSHGAGRRYYGLF